MPENKNNSLIYRIIMQVVWNTPFSFTKKYDILLVNT